MAEKCEEIIVVEDGQPFVEEQLRGIPPTRCNIAGRLSTIAPHRRTDARQRCPSIGHKAGCSHAASQVVVPRPPALCQGCGHRDVYAAINEIVAEMPTAKVSAT